MTEDHNLYITVEKAKERATEAFFAGFGVGVLSVGFVYMLFWLSSFVK